MSLVARPGRLDALALRADPRRAIDGPSVGLVCGRSFRQLTNTHLARHRLSSAGYKRAFGYDAGRALTCGALRKAYQARTRALAPALAPWRRTFRDEPGRAARAAGLAAGTPIARLAQALGISEGTLRNRMSRVLSRTAGSGPPDGGRREI
jgi:hypothetical protein